MTRLKTIVVAALLLTLTQVLHAQVNLQLGSTGIDYIKDLTVDATGHVIAAGYFTGTVNFNPTGLAELTSANSVATGQPTQDNFIARYTPGGQFDWAIRFGGSGPDIPHSVVTDPAGNIYVAGYFSNIVDFDPGPGVASRGVLNNSRDIYLAKYSSAGAYQWAVNMGDTGVDEAFDLRLDQAGNVYMAATFQGTVRPNPADNAFTLSSSSTTDSDALIAKYDNNGVYQWAHRFGSTGNDQGLAIAVDSSGGVYATGSFSGSVDFDPSGGVNTLTSAGNTDVFLLKLDSGGNHQWARRIGGTLADASIPGALEIDPAGNVVVGGNFRGVVDFNPAPAVVNSLAATPGSADLFVAKLTAAGDYIWATRGGGSGIDGAHRMTFDDAGDIYVTGFFAGAGATFGSLTLDGQGTDGATDIFVARLSADGQWQWVRGFGAAVSGSDSGSIGGGIAIDSFGNLVIGGRFYSAVDFNPDAGVLLFTSAGASDAFIFTLDTSGHFVPEPAALPVALTVALTLFRRRSSASR